jgi:site-specific DNA-methyltransferase (adenine-specific)
VNTLYYGDNLTILRDHIKSESIDLIYLDPPFNSNRSYNVLFKDESGHEADAQITAFEDAWHWNTHTEHTYQELVTNTGGRVADMVSAFRQFIGTNQMMAYLVMMAVRLVELHRVLGPTGSLYLHCDPTASHYLKIVLDSIFGAQNFRNEVVWKRTAAHSAAKRWGEVHDVLLFYSKNDGYIWNNVLTPHSEEYQVRFRNLDTDGKKWADDNLTAPGVRHGESGAEWRGFNPTAKGLHWKVSNRAVEAIVGTEPASHMTTTQKLELLEQHGLLHWPKRNRKGEKGLSFPRFKRYLGEGASIQDVIADIWPINSQAQERLGYPTQKPVALLERIIQASSNPGDVVLDPFCGCGTTIAAAQKLNREWTGIDITHLAIALQKYRLKDMFSLEEKKDYAVIGEPEDLSSARQLAQDDRYQFQWWALSLVKARPVNGDPEGKKGKKGKDRGIDGVITFIDDASAKAKRIIVQVKSGKVKSGDIRDLKGTLDREGAAMGVFLTLEPATKDMETEAATAGFYHSPGWNKDYARIQVLTIAELLADKNVQMPPVSMTFKQAEKVKSESGARQHKLF